MLIRFLFILVIMTEFNRIDNNFIYNFSFQVYFYEIILFVI
jgi:hypothetical protein